MKTTTRKPFVSSNEKMLLNLITVSEANLKAARAGDEARIKSEIAGMKARLALIRAGAVN